MNQGNGEFKAGTFPYNPMKRGKKKASQHDRAKAKGIAITTKKREAAYQAEITKIYAQLLAEGAVLKRDRNGSFYRVG